MGSSTKSVVLLLRGGARASPVSIGSAFDNERADRCLVQPDECRSHRQYQGEYDEPRRVDIELHLPAENLAFREWRIAIVVIERTSEAADRSGSQKEAQYDRAEKGAGDVKPLDWQWSRRPNQKERDGAEQPVAANLPHDMKAGVRRPPGVRSMCLVQIRKKRRSGDHYGCKCHGNTSKQVFWHQPLLGNLRLPG